MTAPKKKVWCEHIEENVRVRWALGESVEIRNWYLGVYKVADDWKLCPICGKERPKG